MKIAFGQIRIISKDLTYNFNQMVEMIKKAKSENATMIVFPALTISGFAVEHSFLNSDWCKTVESFNDKIKHLADDILIVWGNLQEKNGELVQTAYASYHQGYLMASLEKKVESSSRYFAEQRYFTNVEEVANTFEFQGKIIAVSFASEEKDIQCDYHIVLDQTPWTMKHEFKYNNYSVEHLLYVNACGMQTIGKQVWMLDGGSSYYHNGKKRSSCNDLFMPELNYSDSNIIPISDGKLLEALTKGIAYFDQQLFSFRPKWIVGLSGGLDSSVSVALLVKALGCERVIAYNLATNNNTSKTIENARLIAEALQIEYRQGSIQADVFATEETLKTYQYTADYPSLVHENIQARLRGHILSTFAAVENGLVINNGNKVEAALGYCTMYGDSVGAINLIGDLTKIQLFELSKEINHLYQKEVIPNNLLPIVKEYEISWGIRPSAELAKDQYDPMKWFYHDYLLEAILKEGVESILASYLDKSIYEKEIGKWLSYYGLNKATAFIEDLEWFLQNMERNQFKRIQAVPGIVVSDAIIGVDYPEAQGYSARSERYLKLKKEILDTL